MGPKVPTRKRSQRGGKASSTEKRSKGNEDRQSKKGKEVAGQSSSPASSRNVPSMGTRQVVGGRCLPVSFLDNLDMELGDMIEEQGWSDFCALNLCTYPHLVRTFYENLIVGMDHIESKVKGKRIIVSEENLSSLLKIPNIGDKFLQLESREKALEVILGRDNIVDIGKLVASSLPIEMRLLHNLISRIFIPRTGRFDWVSERDLAFMERVVKGDPINLPYIMINQMKETTRKANACLPYGMVLTLLFEACNVDLEGEDSKQRHHTETYSTRSLKRMGYKLSDDKWVKKTSNQDDDSSSSGDEEDLEERHQDIHIETPTPEVPTNRSIPSSTEPAADHSSFSTLLDQQLQHMSDNLMSHMTSLFDQLNQSLESKFQVLKEELTTLKGRLDRHIITTATPHPSAPIVPHQPTQHVRRKTTATPYFRRKGSKGKSAEPTNDSSSTSNSD